MAEARAISVEAILLHAPWFEQGINEDVVRLLIHEFGHEYSADHPSVQYHQVLCRIGARMFLLVQQDELR